MNEEQNINQLPKGWKKVTLGEVATYVNGKAFKPTEWSREGLPIIRIQNLNKEKSEFNYCNFKVDEKFFVNKGDLLFAWSGTPDTSFGAHIWKGGKAVLNQHIFKILIDKNQIEKQYYLYALNHKVKEFVSKAHGTAGLAHITKKKFEESEIYLPSKSTQQAIVSKIEELFSELDKGIENLRTAQQQLKTYRQSVLKWAFEGKLTNDNVKEGELPTGWKWVPLNEMIDKIRCGSGVVPSNEISNYPILRSSSVRAGKVNFNDTKYVHKIEKIKKDDFIIKGDLLFTRLNGSIDYVGNCAKVPDVFPNNLIYPDRLFRMRLLKPEYADYIMHFFATSIARRIIEKNAKSTAGHMRISTPDITDMLIPLCPDKEQSKIVQEIESRLSVADKMEESITQSLQQAEALRQSILKMAFEGRLI